MRDAVAAVIAVEVSVPEAVHRIWHETACVDPLTDDAPEPGLDMTITPRG